MMYATYLSLFPKIRFLPNPCKLESFIARWSGNAHICMIILLARWVSNSKLLMFNEYILTLALSSFSVLFFLSHRSKMIKLIVSPSCYSADMDTLRREKVRKYEEFVDRRLKPDLVHAIAERFSFLPCLNFLIFHLQYISQKKTPKIWLFPVVFQG